MRKKVNKEVGGRAKKKIRRPKKKKANLRRGKEVWWMGIFRWFYVNCPPTPGLTSELFNKVKVNKKVVFRTDL